VGDLERLTQDHHDNAAPAISPDSKTIAYWTEKGLATMAADGTNERVVAAVAAHSEPPKWRSAEELVFRGRGPSGSPIRDLFTANTRTGAVANVWAGRPELNEPARLPSRALNAVDLSRTRNEVLYLMAGTVKDQHEFRARSLTDGSDRLLVAIDTPGGHVYSFLVSPDGKKIAYVIDREKGCTPCEVGVLTLETGERRVLANPMNYQTVNAWSPDGRFLLYGGNRPRVVDTTTAESWPLMDPAKQPAWGEDGWGSWSPDGSFVVLVVDQSRADWLQWRGVTADALVKAGSGRGGGR
jgi:Tol biopolymer transport system component